jgi:hypothetical protein
MLEEFSHQLDDLQEAEDILNSKELAILQQRVRLRDKREQIIAEIYAHSQDALLLLEAKGA